MSRRELGAIGVTCPKHGTRLPDATPGVSEHSTIECDLCGCVIMTIGCSDCWWNAAAVYRTCRECGRDFCPHCGSPASISGDISWDTCNECREKSEL